MNGMATFTAGALIRREIRRACMDLGLSVLEDRGWLDSHFRVTGPYHHILALKQFLESYEDD